MSHSPHAVLGYLLPRNHVVGNAKPIRKEIRPDVLKLLRDYRDVVGADGPTPSEASQTTAPAHSIASTGTSMTKMTSTFSIVDEAVQGERSTVPLDPVSKARKALMRKLGACKGDCRTRRVKCKLWHHELHTLLLDSTNPGDESLVEWGLKFDAEPQHPISSTRVANFVAGESSGVRHEALDQATNAFDVPPAPPLPYGSGIQETTASLLDPSLAVSPRPGSRRGLIDENPAWQSRFSIEKNERMFPVGTRDGTLSPPQYSCEYLDCTYTSDPESLLVHFDTHCRFTRLPDPFRMVCPTCGAFHVLASAECCPLVGPSVVEKIFGLFLPSTPILNFPINAGPIPSGRLGLGLSGSYSMNYSPHSSRHSFTSHPQGYSHSYDHSLYNNMMSHARMDSTNRCRSSTSSRLMIGPHFKKLSPCISLITLPFRKVRQFARSRRYVGPFVAVVIISILFGHDWILSKLAQYSSGLSGVSKPNFPLVGVVFMSIAFALHRFVVHAHRYSGARSGSWLSRCAIQMFNMACGRPAEPGRLTYELGHSMS